MGIYDRLGQVKSVGEYDAEAQQLASNKLALLTQQQNFADSNALRDAARSFGDDPEANYRTILGTGNVAAAQAYRKSNYDNQKTQQDIKLGQSHAANFDSEVASRAIADKIKAHDFHLQQLGSLTDPSQIDAWAAQGVKDGVLGMQESMQGAQAMKAYAAQNGFEAAKARAMRGGMSAMQQLQQQLEQTKAQETGRHNVATEGNQTATLAELQRAHRVTEGIAGAHLGLAREQANGVEYKQGEDGTWVALPKKPGAGPIQAAQVVDSSGKPLAGPSKLKDIPPAVNTKIIEGKQGLSNIDKAIAAADAHPDAFGLTNMVPGVQTVKGQWGSQDNVDARAQVANIGSLKLHDRSGAAVSASEFPRLAPFIPSASDSAKTVVTKLKQMKRIAEEELGLYAEAYSPDNGYRAGRSSTAPAGDIHAQADAILRGSK